MQTKSIMALTGLLLMVSLGAGRVVAEQQQAQTDDDHIRILVTRLKLDDYKNTLRGLTQFGDRRQGIGAALDGCALHIVLHRAGTTQFFATTGATRTTVNQLCQG